MAKESNNTQGMIYNALTAGSKIVGNIYADNDYRIDGLLEGDLNCKGRLIIGQQGVIRGNVDCTNAEIYGLMEGCIKVSETLTLRQTAQMQGDVVTNVLVVEPNARFNGSCTMGQDRPEAVRIEELN